MILKYNQNEVWWFRLTLFFDKESVLPEGNNLSKITQLVSIKVISSCTFSDLFLKLSLLVHLRYT